MRWRGAILLGIICLIGPGCSTDVVDFKLQSSTSDLYPTGCKMEVVSFGMRCLVCANGAADFSIRNETCAKLGCQLVDAYADCKICWWSDQPNDECFICSNKTGIYKDTCNDKTPGKGT